MSRRIFFSSRRNYDLSLPTNNEIMMIRRLGWYSFIILFAFTTCKTSDDQPTFDLGKRYETLIKNYNAEKSVQNLNALLQAIGQDYRNSEDEKEKEALLLEALRWTQEDDQREYQALFKKELTKVNPYHNLCESYVFDKAVDARTDKKQNLASIYFDGYARTYPNGKFYGEASTNISMDTSQVVDYVKSLAREAVAAPDSLRISAMMRCKEASEAYAISHPKDTMSAVFLFNTAQLLRENGNTGEALELFDWIYNYYKSYSNAPKALFMKAFIMDQVLKKPKVAEGLYKKMIQQFPKDDFVDDAEFMLKNLQTEGQKSNSSTNK